MHRLGCFLPLDDAGLAAVRGARMALADDAAQHPQAAAIELLVRDSRGSWGDNSTSLVELVFAEEVLAIIGSTERRATHLSEMLAAKFHFPVVTLCGTDPTVTQIPLPWVFCVAHADLDMNPDFVRRHFDKYGSKADAYAALGYDAATLVAAGVRAGSHDRLALRDALAERAWNYGVSGTFRFDLLGRRVNRPHDALAAH